MGISSAMKQPESLSHSYKRILIKLSGEVLMGNQGYGLEPDIIDRIAQDIKQVHDLRYEVCLVIGGGNIWRGTHGTHQGIEQSTSDYMGMLATIINALAMQSALEKIDLDSRVMSAIHMDAVCEPYIRRRAMRHMEKGRIVIFAAGTGNPYFTTDTAAALRTSEMGCDVLMKGTKVDGVYDSDPMKNKDAKYYKTISFNKALSENIGVMDAPALALARENNLPIYVFSILEPGNIAKVLSDEGTFTKVDQEINL